MASPLLAFPYFALIALFYRQSNGFIERYDSLYEYWKTLPVLMLSILCLLLGAGLRGKERSFTAIGLFFGAIGDYLIGHMNDGLIIGATSFGIGHIFYLLTFAHRIRRLSYGLLTFAVISGLIIGYITVIPILFTHPISSAIMTSYCLLLSACLVFSGSIFLNGGINERPFQFNNLLRFIGFALFYSSDTVLVMRKEGFQLPVADKFILSTYFAAQYLIVWGTCLTHRMDALRVQGKIKSR